MKRGPKNKVGDAEKAKVLAILAAGASLKDAADYLEIGYNTLLRARQADPKFGSGVMRAIKNAKIRLIKKVGTAKAWQAAAWMLERRYGREFGRREVIKQEITGRDGGPVKTESQVQHSFDNEGFEREFERILENRISSNN